MQLGKTIDFVIVCFHTNLYGRNPAKARLPGRLNGTNHYKDKMKIFLFWTILICSNEGLECASYGNMTRLYGDLMANYSVRVRPVLDQEKPVIVSILYALVYMNNFDAVNGVLTTASTLQFRWTDENLQWNPQNYGNISWIRLKVSDVWTPVLLLGNSADNPSLKIGNVQNDKSVLLYSDGGLRYLVSGILSTMCYPSITYYPYDQHDCILEIAPLEPMTDVTLQVEASIMIPGAESHPLWTINVTGIRHYVYMYYTFVEASLELKRRPTYTVIVVIIPVMLLNALNIFVFLIPSDSGEKVSFATTILLTISVYLTTMSELIPNTSNPVSILTVSLISKLCISAAILLATVLNLTVYHISDKKVVPVWLCKLTGNGRTKKTAKVTKMDDSTDVDAVSSCTSPNIDIQHAPEQKTRICWNQIGRFLDTVSFGLFTIATILEATVNIIRIVNRIG